MFELKSMGVGDTGNGSSSGNPGSPICPGPSPDSKKPPDKDLQLLIAFDYVDPGSYLVHTLVDDAEWLPLELAPPPGPRVDPHDPEWIVMHEALAEEAGRMGVPFRIPDHVPRSRKAMELALHAAEAERFPQVHAALFRAHFVDGLDLERIDHLVRVAKGCGFEEAEVRTILGVDRFRPEIEAIRARLLEEGIRGVPTIRREGSSLEGFRSADDLKIFLEDR